MYKNKLEGLSIDWSVLACLRWIQVVSRAIEVQRRFLVVPSNLIGVFQSYQWVIGACQYYWSGIKQEERLNRGSSDSNDGDNGGIVTQ